MLLYLYQQQLASYKLFDKMTLKNEEEIILVNKTEDAADFVNSVEVIRRCSKEDKIDTSWERSYYVSFREKSKDSANKTPPFVSIMVSDMVSPDDKSHSSHSSTQTEPALAISCSIGDVSLSFTNDYNARESTSNENSEHFLRSKRQRRRSSGDNRVLRPWKKTKCTESCTSSTSDISDPKASLGSSTSALTSASEISFKSINSNHSFKVRKRRLKSDSNLFRDALQRSRKSANLSRLNYNDDNTSGMYQWIKLSPISVVSYKLPMVYL